MITWKGVKEEDILNMAGGRPGNIINLIIQKYATEDMESIRKSMRHTLTTQLHEMRAKNYPQEVIKYFTDKYYSLPGVTRKKTKYVHKHWRKEK